jgi:hypothetical protein
MKTAHPFRVVVAILAMVAAAAPGQIQEAREAARFDSAQLEQLVAPIALYPDSLLTHVFMASTYPIEVIEADRFVRANPNLPVDTLQKSIAGTDWDPSVKALAGLPDVLKTMSDNLGWMRDLGDAFLSQRTELMDAVQRMRAKAREAGTLTSTPQQTVTVQEPDIVVIESASPEVIYVPTYSPLAVYGGWSYPHWYYPGFYGSYGGYGGLGFSLGFTWGNWLFGFASWGWGASDIWIDPYRYNSFNRHWDHHWHENDAIHGDRHQWSHRPEHRHGVRYRDSATGQRFGSQTGRLPRDVSRGFDRSGTPPARKGVTAPTQRVPDAGRRPAVPRSKADGVPIGTERRDVRPAPRQPDARTAPQRRPDVKTAPQRRSDGGVKPKSRAPRSSSAWSGSRNPSLDRKATDRGIKSRKSAGKPVPRSRGGKSAGGKQK